jgi:hypothetical protein
VGESSESAELNLSMVVVMMKLQASETVLVLRCVCDGDWRGGLWVGGRLGIGLYVIHVPVLVLILIPALLFGFFFGF